MGDPRKHAIAPTFMGEVDIRTARCINTRFAEQKMGASGVSVYRAALRAVRQAWGASTPAGRKATANLRWLFEIHANETDPAVVRALVANGKADAITLSQLAGAEVGVQVRGNASVEQCMENNTLCRSAPTSGYRCQLAV